MQLADTNGKWMTRSDDPDCYYQEPYEEAKTCSICDIVCDIRDISKYMRTDETCPYDDPAPQLRYWKVEDSNRPCRDFLHPLMLGNIDGINRKRRKAAKAYIWKYLREPKWMHALINSGQRMIDVWKRNYRPATFYFQSFETIILYLKTAPREARENLTLARHLRKNLEYSPSFKDLLTGPNMWYERDLLSKLDHYVAEGIWPGTKREAKRRRRGGIV